MPSASSLWLALNREIFSVSIDPITNRETRRGFLSAGTLIQDPRASLQDAKTRGLELVTVRSQDRAGRVWLERVATEALRLALPRVR